MKKKVLDTLPDWTYSTKDTKISKTFHFNDFAQALAFTNKVGQLAEQANHHPEITLGWGKVTIVLWTHTTKTLTEKDISLAKAIEKL